MKLISVFNVTTIEFSLSSMFSCFFGSYIYIYIYIYINKTKKGDRVAISRDEMRPFY